MLSTPLFGKERVMKHYLCIDVGGTSIKYGLLDEEGHICESTFIIAGNV